MTMTKQGCGDRDDCAIQSERRCDGCGGVRRFDCFCVVCYDCDSAIAEDAVRVGPDGRRRCQACDSYAAVKIHASTDLPVFRPSLADLYVAVVAQMVRR